MKRLAVIVFLCGVFIFLTSCSWQTSLPGKLSFASGDTYVGQLRFGVMNGHGTYRYSNGDVYVGRFSNGVMEGKGTFTKRAFGEKTVGEWKNGRRWNVTIYKRDGTVSGTAYKGEVTPGPCWHKRHSLSTECRPRQSTDD